MNQKQQEAAAWVAVCARVIGIGLGMAGIAYEFSFDQLHHPIIIGMMISLMGLAPTLEPIWRQVLSGIMRVNQFSLQIGPLKVEMKTTQPPQPPLVAETLRIPDKLIMKSPTSPSPEAGHGPTSVDESTETS